MGLNIEQIANAELKKLAYLCDTDNTKGTLSQEEFEIFKTEAAKKEGVSAEDFNQAVGLFKTESASVTNPTRKEKREEKKDANFVDKNADERAENAVKRYLDELLAAATTREELMAALTDKIGKQNEDPRYVKLKQAVQEVISVMPTSYTSLKDVHKQKDSVMDAMKAAGIKDNLHVNIYNAILEKMAKIEVRQDALDEIDRLYKAESEKETNDHKKRTNEEIMNSVKASLEADKKYRNEVKDAFQHYESTVIMVEARKAVVHAIKEVKNETNYKKVKDAAKEILQKNGQWDKYTKEVLEKQSFGDAISGTKKFGRQEAERQALRNNVDESTVQSKREVLKTLGTKNEVYEALVSSGLITETDGDIDLSLLSDIIGLQLGSDNTLSRRAKIDKVISEKFKTASAIAVQSKLESLTEKEAKELVKLCGYDVEHKDIAKVILRAVGGFLTGYGMGAAATVTTPRQSVKIERGKVHAELHLKLNNLSKDNIDLSNLPDGVEISETATGIAIDIVQSVIKPDVIIKLTKLVGPIAFRTGIMGAVIGAIEGIHELSTQGEIPVTATYAQETDCEEYLKRLKNELGRVHGMDYYYPLSLLAMSFIREDGSWDRLGYIDALNNYSGAGGKLNRGEVPTEDSVKSTQEAPETEEVTDNNDPNTEEVTDPHSYSQKDVAAEDPVDSDIPVIDGSRTSWTKIAESYDCLVKDHGLYAAIRMVKIAQAITNGDYSKENMEKLYKLSLKGLSAMKNAEGLDYKTYENVLKATYLSKLEKDKDGKIIAGTGVKVPANLAGCGRNDELSLIAEKAGKPNKVVDPNGHYSDKIRIYDGKAAKYYLRLDGVEKEYDNMLERDEDLRKFKEQYPNAEVKKW